AAVYVADGSSARLLGVTRMLVGEAWLHARAFHYCGSIGPVRTQPPLLEALERLGNALAKGFGLFGLFCVDFVMRAAIPWPLEVNPRYTASVEVLEYSSGLRALALHREVFKPQDSAPSFAICTPGPTVVGKAILYAREKLSFPQHGPWMSVLRST